MSILIDKNTRVMTQGITGKTGQFHTRMGKEYANGRNCYVAGVTPKAYASAHRRNRVHQTLQGSRTVTEAIHAAGFNSSGRFYAAALMDAGIEFDVLFGPAYKGIPIASATAVQLVEQHDVDVPWCFNRKEAKDHGEGGNLVGSPLKGRIMLVDDVITAGTAIRESMDLIQANGASLAGVLIALDRQEKGKGELSAIQEVERDYGAHIIAIIQMSDLIQYLEEKQAEQPELASQLAAMKAYRAQYGI